MCFSYSVSVVVLFIGVCFLEIISSLLLSLFRLRQALDDVTSRPPSPSNASLTVGDGMYSALRKTSLAVSHATVTSDSDDGSTLLPGSLR